MSDVIDRFNLTNKFLSNFYPSTIRINGKLFPTVEHAYQALKTTNQDEQEKIRNAVSPSQAKKLGKMLERSGLMKESWDEIKISVMAELLEQKFENPFLRHKLLDTGNKTLIEGNSWHDNFWGSCRCGKCGVGLNMLGKILMTVRENARKDDNEQEIFDRP